MNEPHIPFKILVLAPFLGPACPVWDKAPLRVDPSDPDQVIDNLGPTCRIPIPVDLHPDESIDLTFTRFKDFHPDNVVQDSLVLRNLWEARAWVQEAGRKNLSPQEINTHLKKWQNLPPIHVEIAPQKPRTPSGNSLDKIFDMVALPDEQKAVSQKGKTATQQIEDILKQLLKLVFLDETFRTLEASWRGLRLLLDQINFRDTDLITEIVPVSPDSLAETLSSLTVEVIDALPSLILVDLGFDSTPRSLDLLEKVTQFSETLLIPAVTWIRPAFFNLDSWRDIKRLDFLPHYLEKSAYARWQSLKKDSSSGWVSVTCNRFLDRYPYGENNKPRRIPFEEQDPPWISPVWAMGSLIGKSFAEAGWPTRFTDWQRIRLEDLALNTEDVSNPLPTEANFDGDRMDQFIRSGMVPLAAAQGKDIVFVPDETTMGGISLGYGLLVSRITQLVLWCRDHFEKGLRGKNLEAELRQVFASFWEKSGHPGPESLEISAGQPDPDDRIPVRIVLEPSPDILTSQQPIELDLLW